MNNTTSLTTDRLIDILSGADFEDLSILVDYITDSGAGRLSLSGSSKVQLLAAQRMKTFSPADLRLLDREIRNFGGNSVVNLVRDAGQLLKLLRRPASSLGQDDVNEHLIAYSEVVRNVAERLDVKPAKTASLVEMEGDIITTVLARSFEKMSPDELAEAAEAFGAPDVSFLTRDKFKAAIAAGKIVGVANYIGAAVVANSVSTAVLGRTVLTMVGTQTLPKSIGVFLGPVGWALTGIWSIAELASPAYRVTVPCIVHVAYIRQKRLARMACSNAG